MVTHYSPSDEGYRIVGSAEQFNRTLYGGHAQDHLPEKFFTFAGDQPIVMGTVADWRSRPDCAHAKCGVLIAGVALTPGLWLPIYYYAGEQDGDRTAGWFHEMPGTVATFREGWMDYRVSPFFQCFPRVTARIEVLPFRESDGYLVRMEVSSDQRVHLVIGFGGITGYKGHLEHQYTSSRQFVPEDCRGNSVTVVDQRCAVVSGAPDAGVETEMTLLSSFDASLVSVDARKNRQPGLFLGASACGTGDAGSDELPMLRLSAPVEQGVTFRGTLLVVRNASSGTVSQARGRLQADGGRALANTAKGLLHEAASGLRVVTGDRMLDLTIPSNILALDACWQENAFCHGSFGWHCPYMGWRNWYGATVLGWSDRVQTAFRTHAASQVRDEGGAERVLFDGPHQYSKLESSHGFLPEIPDGRKSIFYTMQEVGVDMILHSILWTGDLGYAREVFPAIARVLEWEARILDSDGDGLYENWLNTWVSDAHSYNGGACAQSSVYNWRANTCMAGLAGLLGLDARPFIARAERTKQALFRELWLADRGIMAEYRDTVGNRLVHPSPELATIYHTIESGIVDDFQAYQMLRFTETDLRNERSVARGGRLVWSSNWYPQNYSSCGLYTAENLHLAWAYLTRGQRDRGHEILSAVVDSHFLSRMPGATAHCMTESGYSDGSFDFTDIISMHLRTVVEGVFGVRRDLTTGLVRVAPQFPAEWTRASLSTRDLTIEYDRVGEVETLRVSPVAASRRSVTVILSLPMRLTEIEGVTLDGREVSPADGGCEIRSGVGFCAVEVQASFDGVRILQVRHAGSHRPTVLSPLRVMEGDAVSAAVCGGTLLGVSDPTGCVAERAAGPTSLHARVHGAPGNHTVFLDVRSGSWHGWLPLDLEVVEPPRTALAPVTDAHRYEPVDITALLALSLDQIHRREFRSPRPSSYSIMTCLNGRFGWDWNQRGYNAVEVDERMLRAAGGTIRSPSGIPFRTPVAGPNVACASVWDNFPTELVFPLEGRAEELAVFLVGTTNPMQSRVENGRFRVSYADGTERAESLVNPVNFDDWLGAPLQTEQETFCFSDHNHGIVFRLALDGLRELCELRVTGVANEVVIGVVGVTLKRPAGGGRNGRRA